MSGERAVLAVAAAGSRQRQGQVAREGDSATHPAQCMPIAARPVGPVRLILPADYEDPLRLAVAEAIGAFTLSSAPARRRRPAVCTTHADRRGDRQRPRDRADGLRLGTDLRRALRPGHHVRVPGGAQDQTRASGRVLDRAVRRGSAGGAAGSQPAAAGSDEAVKLGVPALGHGVDASSGFLLEAILTFFLVLVVFGAAVDARARSTPSPAWRSA